MKTEISEEYGGAMSYFSRSFNPWYDFSEGLYLAGVECENDAKAPNGWAKWTIPSYIIKITH